MAHTSQFCTFYLDKLLFGVELKGVQEVIRSLEMTKVPLAPEVVSGLINLRGQIVTAVDLRRRLELEPRTGHAAHECRGAIRGWRGQPAGGRNWRCG
jgi:purine-binding chemotaxis protein CheW